MRTEPYAAWTILAAAAFASTAHADSFSWEIAGVVSEADNEPALEIERDSLAATYYFDPVDDSIGPYALASFLDPKSRVSLVVSREKQTLRAVPATSYGPPSFRVPPGNVFGPVPAGVVSPVALPSGLIGTQEDYALRGRYVLASKWYVGGGYSELADADPVSLAETSSFERDAYELFFGKYFGDVTAIEVAARSSRTRDEQDISFCAITFCVDTDPFVARSEIDTTRLAAMHVLRGRVLTYAFSGVVARTSGKASLEIPEVPLPPVLPGPIIIIDPTPIPARTIESDLGEFEVYSVGAELFPTAKLGVRIGYSRWDGESTADDAYEVGVTWFILRRVGLQFSYAKESERAPLPFHNESAAIRIVGRL